MPGAENKENKEKKARNPEEAPAILLIDATITALKAGVSNTEIISALRFARGSRGYKAPVWRAAAQSMIDAAKAVGPQNVAQPELEFRGGDA